MMSRSFALIATAVAVVNARPGYVKLCPNGANVEGVLAIGHVNTEGGGPNNAFGLAFKAVGEVWTPELCLKDSDGDGQTNGQELGDPCCQWTPGSNVVLRNDEISHPGDADSTSEPELWANIVCSNSTMNMTSMAGSAVSDVETTPTTTTPAPGGNTAPVASSATMTAGPALNAVVGAAAAIAAFFM